MSLDLSKELLIAEQPWNAKQMFLIEDHHQFALLRRHHTFLANLLVFVEVTQVYSFDVSVIEILFFLIAELLEIFIQFFVLLESCEFFTAIVVVVASYVYYDCFYLIYL